MGYNFFRSADLRIQSLSSFNVRKVLRVKLLVQGVGLQAVGKYARQMDALAKCRNQKVPFSGTVDSSRFPCVTSDKLEKSKMRVKQKVRSRGFL